MAIFNSYVKLPEGFNCINHPISLGYPILDPSHSSMSSMSPLNSLYPHGKSHGNLKSGNPMKSTIFKELWYGLNGITPIMVSNPFHGGLIWIHTIYIQKNHSLNPPFLKVNLPCSYGFLWVFRWVFRWFSYHFRCILTLRGEPRASSPLSRLVGRPGDRGDPGRPVAAVVRK